MQSDTATTGELAKGSAERWGPLWGARAEDWARSEEQQVPTYEAAIREVGIERGAEVLDIGCGTGVFLKLAADRGARPSGLDASVALIELARMRVPEGDLRVGDMEALPFPDDSFDLVTGFNSFFFANDIVAALREAGRVAMPDAPLVIQVWGPHERSDLEAMKQIVRPFMPPRPTDAPPELELWRTEVLAQLAQDAGLTAERSFETTWAFEYANDDELGRAMVAPAGIAELVGPEREAAVKAAIIEGLAPYRTATGGYRLQNQFNFLVARA